MWYSAICLTLCWLVWWQWKQANKQKTFKLLPLSLQKTFLPAALSVYKISGTILHKQKLQHLKGAQHISGMAPTCLYWIFISHESITILFLTIFITKSWAAWSHLWGCGYLSSMHLFSDTEMYRDSKMGKECEQKARSSACLFSTGLCFSHDGTVSFAAVNNAVWLPCSARGASMGRTLYGYLHSEPCLLSVFDQDMGFWMTKDMKSRNVPVASKCCYFICNHLLG